MDKSDTAYRKPSLYDVLTTETSGECRIDNPDQNTSLNAPTHHSGHHSTLWEEYN